MSPDQNSDPERSLGCGVDTIFDCLRCHILYVCEILHTKDAGKCSCVYIDLTPGATLTEPKSRPPGLLH